ncbi:hypothetical protein N9954_06255 [Maribacter sp.]|nr:hypothetical protein [Maribacter sp.]
MKKNKIVLATCALFFQFQSLAIAQDSLTIEVMKSSAYNFDIVNGQLNGEGAVLLEEAIANAHITMLGNSLNSKLDVDFTNALFSILNSNDYTKMVLEIGGISGPILNKLIQKPEIIKELTHLNKKYSWQRNDNTMTPIPNLSYKGSAELIKKVAENDWSLFAAGIESWASYKMLVDELFINLPKNEQKDGAEIYKKTLTLLDDSYQEVAAINIENLARFMATIQNSETFISFLDRMEAYEGNKELIYHFRKSLDYWEYYAEGNAFAKNEISIKESSIRLSKSLRANNIDFEKDKFFIKMTIPHLSKGIAPNGFYGVGSMMAEMTKFHGNNASLSIGVIPRYYERDGVLEDYLESDLYFLGLFKEIIPLGEKEDWVLLDLRSFNEKFIYSRTTVSRTLRMVIERYDFIVIPKTDRKAVINH